MTQRRVIDYGEHAVLVECPDLADTLGLLRALEELRLPEVTELVPGAQTLLLRLAGRLDDRRRRQIAALPARPAEQARTETVTIEVDYTGEDLAEVADLLRMSPDEVVALHTGQTWTVAFCGFAPGFAYLVGEHDRLRVPRRSAPRTRVPAGAVGLADCWSGIYPREGPGGWQLVGTTDEPMWDLDASPPARLRPGMAVRFRPRT